MIFDILLTIYNDARLNSEADLVDASEILMEINKIVSLQMNQLKESLTPKPEKVQPVPREPLKIKEPSTSEKIKQIELEIKKRELDRIIEETQKKQNKKWFH